MGNKGIAIRTILLLLIGVLVAGILIYFVYRFFSGSALSREECRAKAISWCTSCWNFMTAKGSACDDWPDIAACQGGPTPGQGLIDCSEDYYTKVEECEGNKEFCQQFIPIS